MAWLLERLYRRRPGIAATGPRARTRPTAAQSRLGSRAADRTGLPRCPHHPSGVPCPLPRRIEWVRSSIASPPVLPSPFCRRVGIRISPFEACSGWTHVTARRIARPPKATFVRTLQPVRSPVQAARQLPEQSTILRVEPSSTGHPRLRDALHKSRLMESVYPIGAYAILGGFSRSERAHLAWTCGLDQAREAPLARRSSIFPRSSPEAHA
jgi:hypothetical protein